MNNHIFGIKAPAKTCTDSKCPFHGSILVKKELLKGKVIKKDINRSATIEWFRQHFIPKYERYETRRSRMRVHNPACLNAAVGAEVTVARTRPLSKTKNHVIIQIVETTQPQHKRENSREIHTKSTKKTKDLTS